MKTAVTLQDRLTRAVVAPELGGSLVSWTTLNDERALLRPATLPATSPRQLGCYPLVPWSNRVASGGFDTPEGWMALPANTEGSPLAVHGSAWQQPWQVIEQSDQAVLLRLESRVPFAYQAEQHIRLEEGCLSIELSVTHRDAQPAWHGLGLHPYFVRTPATRVTAQASQVWLCDAQQLSTQLSELPAEWDLRQGNGLPGERVDNAFVGWDGVCRIEQEDAGYHLDCRAEGFGYYLLFCPPGQPFFCFEPVSHPVNAHHLPGRPGLVLLREGEAHRASWSMQYTRL